MASISSVISLAVLLLATYCYSVPLVTDYDYTTSGYGFASGKPMASRESMSLTFPGEYTTVHSMINHKRGSSDKNDTSESDEMTTEHSNIKDGGHKRGLSYDATSAPFEATSMMSKQSEKYDYDHTYHGNEHYKMNSDYSMIKNDHKTRGLHYEVTSSPVEATSMISKRSDEIENLDDGYTTERSDMTEGQQKRNSFDEVTSSPYETTTMMGERSLDMESSTEFNSRVGQMGQRESVDMDMTTVFEPTSSGESFSHATGLLKTRKVEEPTKVDQPITYYRKTETIVPGKITKTELTSDGKSQSYSYKEIPVEHQEPSFSEGTTEESDSKTNTDH